MSVDEHIEAIFVGQDIDGDVDIDGVIKAFKQIESCATAGDLPALVSALKSPRNNFWTRELFSTPICLLGGVDYLEPLFDAAQLNLDDGHDNDGFDANLHELAYLEPQRCHAKIESLLARKDFKHHEAATHLLSICNEYLQKKT